MKNNDTGKVLIIPEQLVMLQEMYDHEQSKSAQFREEARSDHGEVYDNTTITDRPIAFPVPMINYDQHRSLETLKGIKEILSNYTLVDTYCQESIEVGTRFQVLISAGKEKESFDLILVHKRVANEDGELFISCDSALGISLKGHKVGDVVTYKGGAGQLCTAEVLKIYANRLGHEIEEKGEGEKLR